MQVWDYVKWNKHALDDWLAKQSDDFRYKHFFKPMLRKYKPTNKRVRGMAYVIQEMTKVYSVDSFTLVSCELVTRKKFVRKATPVVRMCVCVCVCALTHQLPPTCLLLPIPTGAGRR
jgi:hypothetical protein